MALIVCPECGMNMSSTAKACPHCGYAPKQVPVRFVREKALLWGIGVVGTVIVDGNEVGSVRNGESFEIVLTPGEHSVIVTSTMVKLTAEKRLGTDLNIPQEALSVQVEIKPKNGKLYIADIYIRR